MMIQNMITLNFQNIELIPKRFFNGIIEIQLGQITKICGDNGVGKSTFFSYCQKYEKNLFSFLDYSTCYMSQKGLQSLSNHTIKELELVLNTHWSKFFRADWKKRWSEMLRSFHFSQEEMLQYLSGGQLQLIKWMITSLFDRKIFFLDEPFQCLDPQKVSWWKTWIVQSLKEGKTFIIIDHSDKLDLLCDREYFFQFKSLFEVEIVLKKIEKK